MPKFFIVMCICGIGIFATFTANNNNAYLKTKTFKIFDLRSFPQLL